MERLSNLELVSDGAGFKLKSVSGLKVHFFPWQQKVVQVGPKDISIKPDDIFEKYKGCPKYSYQSLVLVANTILLNIRRRQESQKKRLR